MIKFRYLFNGVHHIGFARHYTAQNNRRYFVLLSDGLTLILSQTNNYNSDNQVVWMQIPKNNETNQHDDLIQALGAGLQNGDAI